VCQSFSYYYTLKLFLLTPPSAFKMSSKRKSPPNKLEENNVSVGVNEDQKFNNCVEDLSEDYNSGGESESEDESHDEINLLRGVNNSSLNNKPVLERYTSESSSFHEDLKEATVRTASASLNNSEGGHMETSGDDEDADLSEMGSFCSRTNSEDEEMPIVQLRSSIKSNRSSSSTNGRCSAESLSSNNASKLHQLNLLPDCKSPNFNFNNNNNNNYSSSLVGSDGKNHKKSTMDDVLRKLSSKMGSTGGSGGGGLYNGIEDTTNKSSSSQLKHHQQHQNQTSPLANMDNR